MQIRPWQPNQIGLRAVGAIFSRKEEVCIDQFQASVHCCRGQQRAPSTGVACRDCVCQSSVATFGGSDFETRRRVCPCDCRRPGWRIRRLNVPLPQPRIAGVLGPSKHLDKCGWWLTAEVRTLLETIEQDCRRTSGRIKAKHCTIKGNVINLIPVADATPVAPFDEI